MVLAKDRDMLGFWHDGTDLGAPSGPWPLSKDASILLFMLVTLGCHKSGELWTSRTGCSSFLPSFSWPCPSTYQGFQIEVNWRGESLSSTSHRRLVRVAWIASRKRLEISRLVEAACTRWPSRHGDLCLVLHILEALPYLTFPTSQRPSAYHTESSWDQTPDMRPSKLFSSERT